MLPEKILSKSETFVLRWGLILSLLLLCLLLVISRFIKYPRSINIEGKIIAAEIEGNKKLIYSQNNFFLPKKFYVLFIAKKLVAREIHLNQFLKIKFSEYPIADFGLIKAVVSKKVYSLDTESCTVYISLPEKVTTTKGKKITLDGTFVPTVIIEDNNSNLFEEISEFISKKLRDK